jgi:hypothetical protein
MADPFVFPNGIETQQDDVDVMGLGVETQHAASLPGKHGFEIFEQDMN